MNVLLGRFFGGVKWMLLSLWRSLTQMFHSVGLATCFALFAAAVALASTNGWFDWAAQFIPVLGSAMLAVLKGGLTCFMAFAAGFGFCYFNSQLIAERAATRAQGLAEEIAAKEKLQKENIDLKASGEAKDEELRKLKEQVDKLQSARIDINNIVPILNIGLADVDMSVKETHQEWLEKSLVRSMAHRPTARKFVGICQKDFKTRLGVDLNKACIRVDENKKIIYVSNLVPDPFPGESTTKWLMGEILQYKMRKVGSGEHFDVKDDKGVGYVPDETAADEGVLSFEKCNDVYESERKFEADLSERIKGTSFEGYYLAIRFAREAAKQFVRMILAPCEKAGYHLEFAKDEHEMENWPYQRQELPDFIKAYNVRQLPG